PTLVAADPGTADPDARVILPDVDHFDTRRAGLVHHDDFVRARFRDWLKRGAWRNGNHTSRSHARLNRPATRTTATRHPHTSSSRNQPKRKSVRCHNSFFGSIWAKNSIAPKL